MIEDNNNAKVIAGIRHVIAEMMDSVLNKVLVTDPFIPEQHQIGRASCRERVFRAV